MSVADWARLGKQLGLEAIDLSILFIPDRSLKTAARLRREIEAESMHVTMLTTYPDFTHPEAAQRARELILEQEAVAIAAELGAEFVRVTAGQAHPETNLEEGVAWAIEGLSSLCEATRSGHVTLAYENHAKPGAWTYTDFSQSPEVFLRIVSGTAACGRSAGSRSASRPGQRAGGLPGLGINFDTGNASAFAADPLAMLRQVLPRVVSVHAADTEAKGKLKHVLLGTGVTQFHELFGCLKQSGYDGWICMEEASFQGAAGVEKAARFVRQAWLDA